jgi:L-ascorbate metabolism protein UlaG (beta-lactamase superfamily)
VKELIPNFVAPRWSRNLSVGSIYLKSDIVVEPLFNQWYAWANLIPPASAAMYIANSHLKIMESFVAAPQAHISALKNPALRGGPFINYEASKVGEIKELLQKTRKEQAHMLELAEAIKRLDDMLQTEATGFSLEPLYPKAPPQLRGYVELVYDLHNHPSIRFIEGLLYKSKYYNPGSQSVGLSQLSGDNRSFVFSTPRLKRNDYLFLNTPFDHEGLDQLFKMRTVPQSYGHIKDLLQVSDADDPLFSSFFTSQAPPAPAPYQGDGVRIRYFGHACVLIETKAVSVLSDPVISYKTEDGGDCFAYADLPEYIDYVLITHSHQDHIILEPLLQLRHKIRNVLVPKGSGADYADPSLKLILEMAGFKNVREISEMESIDLDQGRLMAVPFLGEHSDLRVTTKTAYFVELLGRSVLLAADSRNIEPMLYEHVHDLLGDIDVLFLGMECEGAPISWFYGPLFTAPLSRKIDYSRRQNGSDYEKGIEIVDILKPKQVYVYAMGQEPWLTFLTTLQYTNESIQIIESDKLVEQCLSRGLVAERLFMRKEVFL